MDEHEKRLVLQGIIIGSFAVWCQGKIYGNVSGQVANYADAVAAA